MSLLLWKARRVLESLRYVRRYKYERSPEDPNPRYAVCTEYCDRGVFVNVVDTVLGAYVARCNDLPNARYHGGMSGGVYNDDAKDEKKDHTCVREDLIGDIISARSDCMCTIEKLNKIQYPCVILKRYESPRYRVDINSYDTYTDGCTSAHCVTIKIKDKRKGDYVKKDERVPDGIFFERLTVPTSCYNDTRLFNMSVVAAEKRVQKTVALLNEDYDRQISERIKAALLAEEEAEKNARPTDKLYYHDVLATVKKLVIFVGITYILNKVYDFLVSSGIYDWLSENIDCGYTLASLLVLVGGVYALTHFISD